MKNAIKRNDIDNKDLDVKAESTWVNPAIKHLNELKDWILTKLGYPLITVELTDSQLNSCIADALAVYTKYAYNPPRYLIVNTRFYKHKCPECECNPDFIEGLDLTEYNIQQVKDISLQRDNVFGLANDMFFSPYAFFGQGVGSPMFGLGGQSYVGTWTTYHNIHEWFDLAKRMMGSNPDWQYDKNTKHLKLFPAPHDHNRDHFILLTCQCEEPVERYYGNEYVRRLALAESKILLGTIRKKFQNITIVGGGAIDTTIGDEGREEKQQIMENIIKAEGAGQCCIIA